MRPRDLRVVAFAEGSFGPNLRAGYDPFVRIWTDHIPRAASIRPFDRVVPINKKHLIALDPDTPKLDFVHYCVQGILMCVCRQ